VNVSQSSEALERGTRVTQAADNGGRSPEYNIHPRSCPVHSSSMTPAYERMINVEEQKWTDPYACEEYHLEREEEQCRNIQMEENSHKEWEEERNHQQQQLMMLMQFAMSGTIAFMNSGNKNYYNNYKKNN